MIYNYLKFNWKILKRKKIYTAVTLIGISIPVVSIVLISSFLTQINSYEPPRSRFKNVIFLEKLVWEEILENGEQNMHMENPPTYSFIKKYVKTLKAPEISGIISDPVFSEPDIIYRNNVPVKINIRYCDTEFFEITDFKLINGRFFNKNEFENAGPVAVIDENTSNNFFGTANSIGKSLNIENKTFKVIGVIKNVNITLFRVAANIYIPLTCSETFTGNSIWTGWCNALILMKNKGDYGEINSEFVQRLKYATFEGAEPFNKLYSSLLNETYLTRIQSLIYKYLGFYSINDNIFILIIILIVFFFIILPSVNLINLNINRIYERLPEIGVRKAFGANISRLTTQFLYENIIITLIAGIISIFISLIIIKIFNFYDPLSGVILKMNFNSFLISILAMFILSILSGIFPSVTMAKANIVQSLNTSEKK